MAVSLTTLAASARAFCTSPLGIAVLLLMGLFLVFFSQPLITAWKTAQTSDHENEAYFPTDGQGNKEAFPSVREEPSRFLSLVIPAYNEEERMPQMLDEMIEHLRRRQRADAAFTWEMVVVDDGSRDRTVNVVMEYMERFTSDAVRLCQLHKNHGKGGAVRKGMMRCRGQYILMVDADGATLASDLDKLLNRLREVERNGQGIAIGSRAHLEEESKAARTPFRRVLQWGFHTLLSMVVGGGSDIQDTQCGFKLFTRATAARLFGVLHIERWAFDAELLYLAGAFGDIPMVEVPVTWEEIAGSKLDPLTATLTMARDLIVIRLCYMFGVWTVRDRAGGAGAAAGGAGAAAGGAGAAGGGAGAAGGGAGAAGGAAAGGKKDH